MDIRSSGILCHLTSLPSRHGVGDLGAHAYGFVDFLAETGQNIWQMLPLNPTVHAYGNSPYSSPSAFALDPLFCDLEELVDRRLLGREELGTAPEFAPHHVEYSRVREYKERLLDQAYQRFPEGTATAHEFQAFCRDNACWLNDFALFSALKDHFGSKVWSEWPPPARDREPGYLCQAAQELEAAVRREKFLQFTVWRQWALLRAYCREKRIQVMGDIPIYVNYDSADVWAHPRLFKLDQAKRPTVVAGVPPDYFSDTGQLWGNPVYNWPVLREEGYSWWIQRMQRNAELFDLVRIDHFRGLVASWEVAADSPTAVQGQWVEAPAREFFSALLRRFPRLRIVAEDLGMITPDVREVMRSIGFPGMKVLLFAFRNHNGQHPYAPHNYERNCVVYTGTHDNNTARGWFENQATVGEKQRLWAYLGREVGATEVPRELIRLALMSVANTAIIPLQDVLGLGTEARMNTPSTSRDNWGWRFLADECSASRASWLREMIEVYGRI